VTPRLENLKVGNIIRCITTTYGDTFPLNALAEVTHSWRGVTFSLRVLDEGGMNLPGWTLYCDQFELVSSEPPITPEEASLARPLPDAFEALKFMRRTGP